MEITLKNFRCWEQKTIHLAPEGITLLSGPSGVGKSSILEAILFAVTGKGRNIIMQGKSGCSVKFVLNDGTVITRRKRPNIVTLKIAGGKMYEDDAAEGIIREKFTTNFETLGYLGQNGKNTSFVLKGPADKLAFIEQLAFNSINIVELKNKAYELYKNEDNMFTTSTTKEDVLIQQVDECNDISKISFPIKTDGSKESHVSVETKMKDNLVKVSDDIDKVKKKIECFTTMLRKYEHLNDKITNIIKLENNSKKEIKEVEENLSLIDEKVDDELENTKKQLENMRRQRKAIELNNKINENKENLTKLKENEISEMRTKYENIDTWNNGTMKETERDIEEIETEREGILDTLKIQTKLEKLSFDPEILIKKELTRKKNEEEVEKSKENLRKARLAKDILTCPECKTSLKLVGKALKTTEKCHDISDVSDIDSVIETLKISNKRLEVSDLSLTKYRGKQEIYTALILEKRTLGEYIDPKKLLMDTKEKERNMKTYLLENTNNEILKKELKRNIRKEIFSKSIIILQDNIEKDLVLYSKKYSSIDNKKEYSLSEDSLLEKKEYLQKEVFQKENYRSIIKKLNGEYLNYSEEKKDLISKLPKKSSKTIKELIETNRKKEETMVEKKEKYTRILRKIETFNVYYSERQRQKKLKDDLKDTKMKVKDLKNRTSGASILRTKIKEAEAICLLNFVQSIQGEVQMYLDEFFSNDPLSLRLSTQKTLKKAKGTLKKPEINILMDYKGRECDPDSLSGGEIQRLILAFTLAFTERFNLPFLLLDECTSNLDQELTSEVIHVVKKYQHSRPILLVAHQVVAGMFDKIILI